MMETLKEDIVKAKEANEEAALSLDQAKKEHLEMMNQYVKPGYENIAELCEEVKTPFSTGNYFFGRKKTRVPRDDLFEAASGQKLKREPLAEYLREIVINASGDSNNDWKSSSKANGVQVQYSPSRSEDGATFYRAKATLEVPPRHLLLTQIRSNVVGSADENVCYMREHYSFVDGKSFLFHNVRKAIPKILGVDMFQLRDFFDFANWAEMEDGTIIFASQSVNLPAKIKGSVRGDNLIFGIMMKPIKVGEEGETEEGEDDEDEEREPPVIHTEATLVTQFRPNGFAPGRLVDAFMPRGIGEYLRNVETEAKRLHENGETEMLVKKYVDYDAEE